MSRNRLLCYMRVALVSLGLLLWPHSAQAHDIIFLSQEAQAAVSFEQRLAAQVPLDLVFRDEQGAPVQLAQFTGERPLLLALTYFECPRLCPLVRQGLVEALRPLAFSVGDEFDVVIVSIDPTENAANASAAKAESLARYERPESAAGWHFLTGDHETIDQLAAAIGFRYAYDERQGEYAHASGVLLLTPTGRIARYFYGIEYNPRDLRLGLVEAAEGRIGNPVDQLLLLCYRYDPAVGQYNLLILNVMRAAALMTVVALGALIFILRRREATHTTDRARLSG